MKQANEYNIGTSRYSQYKYQPSMVSAWYAICCYNGRHYATPIMLSLLKYISPRKGKVSIEDLNKAKHLCLLAIDDGKRSKRIVNEKVFFYFSPTLLSYLEQFDYPSELTQSYYMAFGAITNRLSFQQMIESIDLHIEQIKEQGE